MDFLPQQNRRIAGEPALKGARDILAKDKHVIVIGGGDTGSDCIGTSFRQGARSVTQLEIMPMPPENENKAMTWPNWPLKLRISTSQAEGAKVTYSVSTTGFSGSGGKVEKLHYVEVDPKLQPVAGTDAELPADLVLLAMGFSGPVEEGLVAELGLEVVARGRFKGLNADERDYKVAGREKLFAAGDIRRGQSLVVWAIREGRQAAHSIDKFLMGTTTLPR
jgi:glutamate synthase (NADPH/NADH) small chain